ncbi:dethiobiotin synthase [Legionella israelensis]|uniref:ATP-dependent dethiobiotin synthetase BioD n=1 Tax=Legionella israelensis TaxID=454 RepID=A0A0W0VMV8_9GAMM|nr:dethiobiotin synthase [Legionella israelensis]KTD21457.1 Dethiobiotin synthetase [Legionella israelensis]QBR84193.1 dethiobiotin synthase [Legionella israelensis]QBS08453.1 dethiobiotin synthase [Legionella israelensis]SCY15940.1 dethiobiotin synthetase [Legionella israelensis DSM 19235]STX58092.1 Dethiobiotin synthetase [Legionella israelensis]
MKRYFITGTDTDCGKTYATCELLKYLALKSFKVEAIKPVASGCVSYEGKLVSPDSLAIREYSQLHLEQINPWAYEMPVSPHIAASAVGDTLSVNAIVDYCFNSCWNYLDYLLIEGAGGVLVPLNEHQTWLDMLKLSQLPVILVVGIQLGCINHALLTESVLMNHHIPCAGWIANYAGNSLNLTASEQTIETLLNHLKMPYLGFIPYKSEMIIVNPAIL